MFCTEAGRNVGLRWSDRQLCSTWSFRHLGSFHVLAPPSPGVTLVCMVGARPALRPHCSLDMMHSCRSVSLMPRRLSSRSSLTLLRKELDSPGFKASPATFQLCDPRHFLSEPIDRVGSTLGTWPHLAAHVPRVGPVGGLGGPANSYAERLVHTLAGWLSWLAHPPLHHRLQF